MSHIYPAQNNWKKNIIDPWMGILSELAEIIGISQQQQSRYERGINRVSSIDFINMLVLLIFV